MKRVAVVLAAALLGAFASAGTAGAAPCPEDTVDAEVSGVPRFLLWGARAEMTLWDWGETLTEVELSWTHSAKREQVFARTTDLSDGWVDFWIRSEHPLTSFGFLVSYKAAYWDLETDAEAVCEGSLGSFTIRSGLDTRIVIGRSVAAVQLFWREARVRAALGPPRRVFFKFGREMRVYSYPGSRLNVWFLKRRGVWTVHSVRTTSRVFRTQNGAGVETTVRALKRLHPGLRCFGNSSGWQQCQDRRLSPAPTTLFDARRGVVTASS